MLELTHVSGEAHAPQVAVIMLLPLSLRRILMI